MRLRIRPLGCVLKCWHSAGVPPSASHWSWHNIRDCESWADLPEAARDYVQFIATFTKTRVKLIAVEPGREETIILPRSIGRGGAV